jgi:hypothetical protein
VLLSTVSNVRLDSYVFTAESFAAARKHLKKGGVLVLSHAVGLPWFVERMRATLSRAFGKPPDLVSERAHNPLGFVYAAGDDIRAGDPVDPDTTVLEDDWPFVYLRARAIPREYLIAMALMAVASLALVRGVAGPDWGGPGALHFAALGAGFLLLETRGLSVLSLVLGSTWGVTSAVFAGVLVMALASTAIAAKLGVGSADRRRRSVGIVYILLVGALGIELGFTTGDLAPLPLALRAVLGAVLVSLPLLAGGTVFATSLARSGSAERALAANLIGAMAGGLLEYVSMIIGFRALVLVAAVLYGVAFLSREQRSTGEETG